MLDKTRLPDLFEAVRQRVPITDVAARHTRELRPGCNGRASCRCVCNAHEDRQPSVMLYPDGSGHCFACDTYFGDCIALHAFATQRATDTQARVAACRDLADLFGVRAGSRDARTCASQAAVCPRPTPSAPSPWATELLALASAHYTQALWRAPNALAYLCQTRGLSNTTIQTLRLGYATGRDLLPILRGHSPDARAQAAQIGLLKPDGATEFLRRRIVCPIPDATGAPVFLIGRALNAQSAPRYLSLPNTDFLRRQPLVLGQPHQGVLIVEGPFDAATALQWGLCQSGGWQVIALLGVGHRAVAAHVNTSAARSAHRAVSGSGQRRQTGCPAT